MRARCSVSACTLCRPEISSATIRHVDFCSPPGTRPSTSLRSRTSGCPEAVVSGRWLEATSEVLRETFAACGSGTSPTSSRASGMRSDMALLEAALTSDDGETGPRLMALVAGASLEMSPRERDAVVPAAQFLAPGTECSSARPPAVSHHDIVSAAVALRRHGFEPVPHVAARSLHWLHPTQ